MILWLWCYDYDTMVILDKILQYDNDTMVWRGKRRMILQEWEVRSLMRYPSASIGACCASTQCHDRYFWLQPRGTCRTYGSRKYIVSTLSLDVLGCCSHFLFDWSCLRDCEHTRVGYSRMGLVLAAPLSRWPVLSHWIPVVRNQVYSLSVANLMSLIWSHDNID